MEKYVGLSWDLKESLMRYIWGLDKLPLEARQAARLRWSNAMQNPGEVAAAASDILCGDYETDSKYTGLSTRGSYGYACEILHRNKHNNRVAQLAQLTAAVVYGCPVDFARQAWVKLPKYHQERVNAELAKIIDDPDYASQTHLANEIIGEIIAEEKSGK